MATMALHTDRSRRHLGHRPRRDRSTPRGTENNLQAVRLALVERVITDTAPLDANDRLTLILAIFQGDDPYADQVG